MLHMTVKPKVTKQLQTSLEKLCELIVFASSWLYIFTNQYLFLTNIYLYESLDLNSLPKFYSFIMI